MSIRLRHPLWSTHGVQSEQSGAVLLESAFVLGICCMFFVFVCDAGLTFYRYSKMAHTTTLLVGQLARDLGSAFNSETPTDRNCNVFLRNSAAVFLGTQPGDHSANNAHSRFYYGSTLDNSEALDFTEAPYGVLQIEGTMRASSLFAAFIPDVVLHSKRVALVEYKQEFCTDY